uniref:Plasmalemma vesicle associated protein a n=1 Tax=Oryzias melastigma TaxID=30732 RepID=A0A3B3BGV9_ORYME
MYSCGYSQVSKQSPQAKKTMQYRSKNKSCGYYMRIVFFFSSLIQSLIIVSLVLFLLYGKSQDTACAARTLDLEESFSRLSIDNVALKQQRKNLTNMLNATTTNKVRCEFDLRNLRLFSNKSIGIMLDCDKKLVPPCPSSNNFFIVFPLYFFLIMIAKLQLLESNFTSETRKMRMDMDQMAKERDNLNLVVIHLRKDKSAKQMELLNCQELSKADISKNLGSVSKVTHDLLGKIESVFPKHVAFQLSCKNQQDHLEQIHRNCTRLSREVEGKLQSYLNGVAEQLFNIQTENSRFKSENSLLYEDYRWCSQNRTGLIEQHRQSQEEMQQRWDKDKERLLMEKMKLNGEMEVLKSTVRLKTAEIDNLGEQLRRMNLTCPPKVKPFLLKLCCGEKRQVHHGSLSRVPGPPFTPSRPINHFDITKFGLGGLGHAVDSTLNKPRFDGAGSTGTGLFNAGGGGPTKPEGNIRDSSSLFKPLESPPKFGSSGLDTNKPAAGSKLPTTLGSGASRGGSMPAFPSWPISGSRLGQSNSEAGRMSGGGSFGSSLGQGRTTGVGGGQSTTDFCF